MFNLIGLVAKISRDDFLILLVSLSFVGLVEATGVLTLMPLASLVISPEYISSNIYLRQVHEWMGVERDNFVVIFGVASAVLIVSGIVLRLLVMKKLILFVSHFEISLSRLLLEHQLRSNALTQDAGSLQKQILGTVQEIVQKGVFPLAIFLSQAIVGILICLMLLVVSPWVALVLIVTFGLALVSMAVYTKSAMAKHSSQRFISDAERYKLMNGMLNALRTIKTYGLSRFFLARFSEVSEKYVRSDASAQMLSMIPRFAIELFAITIMFGVLLSVIVSGSAFAELLPVVVLFVVSGYRLLPAVQQCYTYGSLIRFAEASVTDASIALSALTQGANEDSFNSNDSELIDKKTGIRISNLSVDAPNNQPIVRNLSLELNPGESLAVLGASGVGKSTLMNIVLGLARPLNGRLSVGSCAVYENISPSLWLNYFGLVEQRTPLITGTIAENVALGVDRSEIDRDAIARALTLACVDDLDPEMFLNGANASLSGGQVQRICVARSIYLQRKIAIYDEPTSALDPVTQDKLMTTLKDYVFPYQATFLVTHRLKNALKCDRILMLQGEGNYEIIGRDQFAKLDRNNVT